MEGKGRWDVGGADVRESTDRRRSDEDYLCVNPEAPQGTTDAKQQRYPRHVAEGRCSRSAFGRFTVSVPLVTVDHASC
jgi:hypothetical protein